MRFFTPLLTLALTLLVATGCLGNRGLERHFTRDTAHDFRTFHEAARGGAEMLGEAAVSVSVVADREGTIEQLDDALLDLAAADLSDGNEALIAAARAINDLAAGLVDVPAPSTLTLEQVEDLREAYIFASVARDLAETATALRADLSDKLRYEVEARPRAAEAAAQALELAERMAPIVARQHEISLGYIEGIERLSEEQAIDLPGPEYPHALRRKVAPATIP